MSYKWTDKLTPLVHKQNQSISQYGHCNHAVLIPFRASLGRSILTTHAAMRPFIVSFSCTVTPSKAARRETKKGEENKPRCFKEDDFIPSEADDSGSWSQPHRLLFGSNSCTNFWCPANLYRHCNCDKSIQLPRIPVAFQELYRRNAFQ